MLDSVKGTGISVFYEQSEVTGTSKRLLDPIKITGFLLPLVLMTFNANLAKFMRGTQRHDGLCIEPCICFQCDISMR